MTIIIYILTTVAFLILMQPWPRGIIYMRAIIFYNISICVFCCFLSNWSNILSADKLQKENRSLCVKRYDSHNYTSIYIDDVIFLRLMLNLKSRFLSSLIVNICLFTTLSSLIANICLFTTICLKRQNYLVLLHYGKIDNNLKQHEMTFLS